MQFAKIEKLLFLTITQLIVIIKQNSVLKGAVKMSEAIKKSPELSEINTQVLVLGGGLPAYALQFRQQSLV